MLNRGSTGARAKRPGASLIQRPLELPTEQDMVTLEDMTEWERMVADYRVLGLSPSAHPIGLLRPEIPPDVLTADQLRKAGDGAYARTAGMVVCRQRPGTAKGIVFLLLEDETGVTNVVVRPELYEAQRSLVRREPYLVVEGEVQIRSGSLNLLAHQVGPLLGKPLPRVTLRHSYPGHPHDVREHPELFTPPSHDFH
ncbi:MAG TPA: OB-fold nucleic acid binding domain-containing protein [Chloroflexota bacterium]|nr:OB-fold nucleic acid binding domain-containing protein [Chloroflexota bacterium]